LRHPLKEVKDETQALVDNRRCGPRAATVPAKLIYTAALIAALACIASAFGWLLLNVSATAWVMAFTAFAITCWPLLTRPRRQIT
jgi:uncharacterized protein involved in response to NO